MTLGFFGVHPETVDDEREGPGLVLNGEIGVLGSLKVTDAGLSGQLDGCQVPVSESAEKV